MRVSRALLLFEAIALCAVLQVSCHSSPNQPEKTEAQRIVDAFREKVNADLQAHKGRKDVWPQAQTKYEEAGWYMEADELPSSYSINVEKTESLVSPYLGTAEFPVTGNVSYPKNSREEALEATQFKSSYTINHKYPFFYSNSQHFGCPEACLCSVVRSRHAGFQVFKNLITCSLLW